jgi:hypothetical protein
MDRIGTSIWSRVGIHFFPRSAVSFISEIYKQRRRCKQRKSSKNGNRLLISIRTSQKTYSQSPSHRRRKHRKRSAVIVSCHLDRLSKLKCYRSTSDPCQGAEGDEKKSGIFHVLLSIQKKFQDMQDSPGIRSVYPPTRTGLKVLINAHGLSGLTSPSY